MFFRHIRCLPQCLLFCVLHYLVVVYVVAFCTCFVSFVLFLYSVIAFGCSCYGFVCMVVSMSYEYTCVSSCLFLCFMLTCFTDSFHSRFDILVGLYLSSFLRFYLFILFSVFSSSVMFLLSSSRFAP